MAKNVYIGHIQNDIYDAKTLVIAESVTEAREKVLEKFSKSMGDSCQEQDLRIKPFAVGET